jgi:hypothetical protein
VAEDKGLTAADNVHHLERIVSIMEWLHGGVQEHKKPWCFVVIDSLHLTHCARPGVVKWSEIESFDQRLAALGCKLLFLEASPPALWERGIKPRVNEQFMQYTRKFGGSHEAIHQYFVREQATLSELFSRSTMSKLLVGNDGAPEAALDAAFDFWIDDDQSRIHSAI